METSNPNNQTLWHAMRYTCLYPGLIVGLPIVAVIAALMLLVFTQIDKGSAPAAGNPEMSFFLYLGLPLIVSLVVLLIFSAMVSTFVAMIVAINVKLPRGAAIWTGIAIHAGCLVVFGLIIPMILGAIG